MVVVGVVRAGVNRYDVERDRVTPQRSRQGRIEQAWVRPKSLKSLHGGRTKNDPRGPLR